ncbi:hypothetical protein MMC25_000209 [Agyrium rufum]|nr:hypothetical protein [Agyrium rufum]
MDDNEVQYGCIIPDVFAPAIDFNDILSEELVGASVADSDFTVPPVADHLKPFSSWKPLGNKVYSVCNALAWANTRRIITSKLTEQERYPPLDEVFEFYKTQNSGFKPPISKKSQDKGMIIQTSLEHLVKYGGPDGQRALAFAKVNHTDIPTVQKAIATFGSIWLGLKVYPCNKEQFDNGEQWTPPVTGEKFYAHAVVAGAYDTAFKIVTWDKVVSLSPEYWNSSFPGQKLATVFEAYVVIWPEHIGTRRFMTGVSLQQLAEQYYNVTQKDLELPKAHFNSLFRCQNTGKDGGCMALQKVDAATSYSSVPVDVVIDIDPTEGTKGSFAVESDDLFFIKTRDTASTMVEVQRIQNPKYNHIESWISTFKTAEASDGLWTIDNGDLYFIKTANTASGMIELWQASHQSGFQQATHYTSGIKIGDIGFGTYAVSCGSLYVILDANNPSEKVEIISEKIDLHAGAKRKQNRQPTGFKINDVKGRGTWSMGQDGDLFLIKTRGTESGLVELHIASKESTYLSLSHYSTGFPAGQSGVWMIY